MEIKDFIVNFNDQFDECPTGKVTQGTQFRNLDGWSSIVALSVITMIEEEYGVQLKSTDMRKACTIQELFDMVKSLGCSM